MPSLTRREAVQRAALLTVRNYRIALDLTMPGNRFCSDTTITFAASEPGASTFLDLRAAEVLSVHLNDEPVDPAGLTDGRLPLTGLRAENTLRVQALMAYSSDGEGIHRHVDPADGRTYLYAMSFLDAAPRWFACFDQPDLKAGYDIDVQCPPDWTVIGNSPASRTAPGHWQLSTTQPLATYFVTLVAGPYASVTAEHDGIVLGLHARASLAEHLEAEAADILGVTAASLDRYHELFGIRYPFQEYHQAFVPDFNAGAMENPGCVTLRDQYVFRSAATRGERCDRASTIAHEMAHMWFGDLVTMRWWDDLWLNESFAEYMGYRVCAELADSSGPDSPAALASLASLSWLEFGLHRKDWGRVADQAPSKHPVAGNGSEDAATALADFDGISYAKGASVLKQLAAHLGDEVFFAGLRLHFSRHRFGNAEFADLIEAWTEAGAQDLAGWAELWLRTSGLDTLTAEQRPDDGGPADVWLGRSSPDGTRRPHTVRVAGFDGSGRQLLDEQVTLHGDEVPVGRAAGPLRLVVADSGDDSWAKIRFGAAGWQAVAELLPRIEAAPTRVVLYNAIRDAVRDAELDSEQALDMVLAALAREPVELVTAELLQFATEKLAGCFAVPADRPARRARIAELAHRLLATAPPGSDAQLEAARAGIRASDDPDWLVAWEAGRQLPPGLVIDAELRWALVTRLAALGALSAADIDAELARDESTAGVVHAARARAMRPDPAAKADTWALLTQPSERPVYELYASAEGFFEPGQHELTAPYLPRFFAEMPGTAGHRRGWALGAVIGKAFPVAAASGEVLDLAEQTVAADRSLDPAVRRALVDGTDTLRRAVRSLRRSGRL
ncbi:aminopeptidase N [Jatrophihabitans sp.]|uniref:aminopeptidase N n=1 Tax=Jatrophihabitans sp. TaxID=1932789 RepID=UPI002D15C623|nr:aminopeptidase N [Jatrophihabitans sp.]